MGKNHFQYFRLIPFLVQFIIPKPHIQILKMSTDPKLLPQLICDNEDNESSALQKVSELLQKSPDIDLNAIYKGQLSVLFFLDPEKRTLTAAFYSPPLTALNTPFFHERERIFALNVGWVKLSTHPNAFFMLKTVDICARFLYFFQSIRKKYTPQKKHNPRTAIHWCCYADLPKVLEMILSHQKSTNEKPVIDLNTTDSDGYSPAISASMYMYSPNCLKLLIGYDTSLGLQINHRDSYFNRTVAHYSSVIGNPGCFCF